MDSRFERGDVIAEKDWIGQTIQYVVLDTVFPTHNFIYSQNGYISTLPREQEHYYAKIGHIDLKPLWKQIRDIGKQNKHFRCGGTEMETKVYPYEECEKCDKREKISNNVSVCPSMKIRCVKQLEEHDKQIRTRAIDECIETLYDVTPQTADQKLDMIFVNALRQLKGE